MKVNDPDALQRKIAIAAYLRAESRNFAPGHEVADWLAAEAEVARETTPAVRPAAPGRAPAASKPQTAAAVPKTAKTVKAVSPPPSTDAGKSPAKPRGKRPPATP